MGSSPHARGHFISRLRPLCSALTLLAFVPACQSAPTPSAPPPPPAVHVQKAAHSASTRLLRLSGTLEPERSTTLSFAVMGTVEQVFVQEGQAIKAGQAIARVSPRSYRDALNMAKSKANQAEDAHRRLKPMFDNKTLPAVKMVEVDSGLEQARLAVSMAAKNVQDTVLRAPSAGIVARRLAEPGTGVAPGTPVVSLVQTKTILATAPVPETRVANVKPGYSARIFVPALDRWFDGLVRDVGVVADPLTRTYPVRVALQNADGSMRIGMVAQIALPQDMAPSILVPPTALRIDEKGLPYLFVVDANSKIERRPVKLAGYVGEGSAIAEGISDGELVVTSGTPMLDDGMLVRVAERKGGDK